MTAIIVAAGVGKRLGVATPKQYLELFGRPLICHTLDHFRDHESVIVVVEKDRVQSFSTDILQAYDYPSSWKVVEGGKERQDSVWNGLCHVPKNTNVVLIHDGVRPFISSDLITEVAKRAYDVGAAIVASPVTDTIKRVGDGVIVETVDRKLLWRAQTPQAFRTEIIREAFEAARRDCFCGTDDASLVERMGKKVSIVPCDIVNMKVTTPDDLKIAEMMIRTSQYH